MMRTAKLLLLLVVAAPGLGQDENAPYFSLSSSHTFASNGKPSVEFSAWNVDSLEFRVYRVNDPLQFFQQLENAHQFGGSVPRPPRAAHAARAGACAGSAGCGRTSGARCARNSRNRRARIWDQDAAGRTAKPGSRETHYAEAPVLNQQQLVLSFVQPVRGHSRWERRDGPAGRERQGRVPGGGGPRRAAGVHHPDGLGHRDGDEVGEGADRQPGAGSRDRRAGSRGEAVDRDAGRAAKPQSDTDADGVAEIKLAAAKPGGAPAGGAARRRLRGERALGVCLRREYRSVDGVHLYRPSGLSPGPHGPLQRNSAAADGERARGAGGQSRCRWRSTIRSRSRSIARR